MGHAIDQFLFINLCLQAVMTTIQNLALCLMYGIRSFALTISPHIPLSVHQRTSTHHSSGLKKRRSKKKRNNNKKKITDYNILSALIFEERYNGLDALPENMILT